MVSALKSVDFPTFGRPTIPMDRALYDILNLFRIPYFEAFFELLTFIPKYDRMSNRGKHMSVTKMHPRVAGLALELGEIMSKPDAITRPTRADRNKLMIVRDKIKDLSEDESITADEEAECDRQYLYVEATMAANVQEDFYERNGHKWAE